MGIDIIKEKTLSYLIHTNVNIYKYLVVKESKFSFHIFQFYINITGNK